MDVKGCFVFRNEGDGCLTSKYLEHSSIEPFTESARLVSGANGNDPFEGVYRTTWLEPIHRSADLRIKNISSGVYDLHWKNITEPDSPSKSDWEYEGRAMLFEGNLVGCYWRKK